MTKVLQQSHTRTRPHAVWVWVWVRVCVWHGVAGWAFCRHTQFGASLRTRAGPDCQLRMCKQANKPSRRQGLIVIVSRERDREREMRGIRDNWAQDHKSRSDPGERGKETAYENKKNV